MVRGVDVVDEEDGSGGWVSDHGSMADLPGGEEEVHFVLGGGGGISIVRGDASMARVAASEVSKMASVARSRFMDVLVVSYWVSA